jgi:hypothetical protein
MNAKLNSGLQVLGWGALASFAVVIYNNTPIDLGGPFSASIINKPNGSEEGSIVIEGAKVQESLSNIGVTVAVQDSHGQDTSKPVVATYKPDGGNHILLVSADSPGHLDNLFVNTCPKQFPIPKVAQSEGLAGILIARGQDASEAEKLQESLMASDTEHGLAYRDSVISGKDLIPAIAKANLSVQFESSRDYVVHQYRFSCSDGKSNEGSKITNYFVVAPKLLARHR